MFKSAAEELGQWADQCRRWARGAHTREQRLVLQSLERILSQAALEAEDGLDIKRAPRPLAPSQVLK
jgi:hypothetical protein